MIESDGVADIWKALADPTRRHLLDRLRKSPATTGDLVESCPDLSRFGVMKHLSVLVAANLVLVRREGRQRWNHLNPVPIQLVCERWIAPYAEETSSRMLRLKRSIEKQTIRSSRRRSLKE